MGESGDRGFVFNRYTVSVWKDEKVLGKDGGNRWATA